MVGVFYRYEHRWDLGGGWCADVVFEFVGSRCGRDLSVHYVYDGVDYDELLASIGVFVWR
jgi:hypothetical protein